MHLDEGNYYKQSQITKLVYYLECIDVILFIQVLKRILLYMHL
jgi:hypothetical protein